MRWLLVLAVASASCKSARQVGGAVAWVVALEADRLKNGDRYRREFLAEHPECIPSTVEASGPGDGNCTTTRGCHEEASCFLECETTLTCP